MAEHWQGEFNYEFSHRQNSPKCSTSFTCAFRFPPVLPSAVLPLLVLPVSPSSPKCSTAFSCDSSFPPILPTATSCLNLCFLFGPIRLSAVLVVTMAAMPYVAEVGEDSIFQFQFPDMDMEPPPHLVSGICSATKGKRSRCSTY